MKEPTKSKILEIINHNKNIKINEDQSNVSFDNLGIDSIDFVRIVVEIEDYYECFFPDEMLIITRLNTVDKIFDVLKETLENSKN